MSRTPGKSVRLVFVGGCPRSGTTLLQNMLDSQGDIFGGPEFRALSDIVSMRDKLRELVETRGVSVFCSGQDVDRSVAAFIENLLTPVAVRNGRSVLSEKTPENVLWFSQLTDLFPRARFLFVVRDPRAIVSSMLEVGQRARSKGSPVVWFTQSLIPAIRFTFTCMEAGFRAVEKTPDRISVVKYEDLVCSPESETKKIARFLSVPWTPAMLRPGEKKHAGEIDLDGVWYDAKMYYRNPDQAAVGRSMNRLSELDQATIAVALESLVPLARLGYDLSSRRYPAWVRVAARARWALAPVTGKIRAIPGGGKRMVSTSGRWAWRFVGVMRSLVRSLGAEFRPGRPPAIG